MHGEQALSLVVGDKTDAIHRTFKLVALKDAVSGSIRIAEDQSNPIFEHYPPQLIRLKRRGTQLIHPKRKRGIENKLFGYSRGNYRRRSDVIKYARMVAILLPV